VETLETKGTKTNKLLEDLSPNKSQVTSGQGTTTVSNGINVQFVEEELDLE
jgi:hypothetical protein